MRSSHLSGKSRGVSLPTDVDNSAGNGRGQARPLHPSEADELGWFLKERVRASKMAAWVTDARFADARKRFNAPRYRMLHRLWQRYGETILWDAKSTILADQLERGWGRVEFLLLARSWAAAEV
jgi:hypothetical protein